MKKIIISEEDYLKLRAIKMKMTALEYGGVDNWAWYGESLSGFKKDWVEQHASFLQENYPNEDFSEFKYLDFSEMAEIELKEERRK